MLGRRSMVPAKKHPLEIFRELGSAGLDGVAGKRRKRKASGRSPAAPARQKNARSNGASRSGRKDRAGSPGDFKITLTLNQVLVSFVVVTVLVLGGYFAGYYKGGGDDPDSRLLKENSSTARLKDPAAPARTEGRSDAVVRDAKEGGTRKGTGVAPKPAAWGVLTATYNLSQENVARRTKEFFVKRGFKKVLLAEYRKDKKYAIVIGSYDRENHPDLVRLLEVIQTIDDFPTGDRAPFKGAQILRLPGVKS
jgi:hypothetical protein